MTHQAQRQTDEFSRFIWRSRELEPRRANEIRRRCIELVSKSHKELPSLVTDLLDVVDPTNEETSKPFFEEILLFVFVAIIQYAEVRKALVSSFGADSAKIERLATQGYYHLYAFIAVRSFVLGVGFDRVLSGAATLLRPLGPACQQRIIQVDIP